MTNFYNKKHHFEFIFPIENLELVNRKSFTVGRVTFSRYTKYKYNKTLKMLRKIISKKSYYQVHPNAKRNAIESLKEHYYSLNIGEICAYVEEYGHVDDAYLKAIHDVKIALNIFKLYRNPGYLDDDQLKTYFDIKGEIIKSDKRSVLTKAVSSDNYRASIEKYSYLHPFEIETNRINFMKQNGFNILNDLLKQKRYNRLDERIISAINWFGKSFNSHIAIRQSYNTLYKSRNISMGRGRLKNYGISEPERLVCCITGLEGLLSFSNNEDYKCISVRISKIIGQNVLSLYHRLYKIRCAVVHGSQSYVDKRDVKAIFNLTQRTIFSFIMRKGRLKIHTVQDFRDWLP